MRLTPLFLGATVVSLAVAARAQQPQATPQVSKIVATPEAIRMKAGDTVDLKITALDAQGNAIPGAQVMVFGPMGAFAWNAGRITAMKAGRYEAMAAAFAGGQPVMLQIPLTITWPALSKLAIVPDSGRLYTDVTLGHRVKGWNVGGTERPAADIAVTWRSSSPSVASVDRFGNVTGIKPGTATISAQSEGVSSDLRYTVAPNPVSKIDIGIKEDAIHTGDVVHLLATARRVWHRWTWSRR